MTAKFNSMKGHVCLVHGERRKTEELMITLVACSQTRFLYFALIRFRDRLFLLVLLKTRNNGGNTWILYFTHRKLAWSSLRCLPSE